ncbi:CACNA1B [Symbiodinium natans]|uniref:CACNA1B protein n=1 Tax=Symbiodinium natans TaxID=878477 RepID=A0A812HV09_9DINO|nr:CACNA1B [Symbiodinium natans]
MAAYGTALSLAAIFKAQLCTEDDGCRKAFFTEPKNLAWNIMDVIIVTSAFVEIVVQDSPPGVSTLTNMRVLRIIRITRLVRLTRIARITRFIKALRTLVTSIVFTLKSLVWALVLLSLIIYGLLGLPHLKFGIVFTQAATLYLLDHGGLVLTALCEAIDEYWHDLPASMLTLFMLCGSKKRVEGGV